MLQRGWGCTPSQGGHLPWFLHLLQPPHLLVTELICSYAFISLEHIPRVQCMIGLYPTSSKFFKVAGAFPILDRNG